MANEFRCLEAYRNTIVPLKLGVGVDPSEQLTETLREFSNFEINVFKKSNRIYRL